MKTRAKKPVAVKRSVSFPDDLLLRAQKKASEESRTFSNYIQALVARDLERNGKAVAA